MKGFLAILRLVAPAVVGGVLVFVWRAARSSAKTDVEIAAEDLARADKAVADAHATPDGDDDVAAEKKRAAADHRLRAARRLRALTDALPE